MTKYFRVRRPDDKRRSWTIEEKLDGKWIKAESAELAAVNLSFKSGALTYHQAKERVARLLEALYIKRDIGKRKNTFPGNEALVKNYMVATYTPQKRLRMEARSIASAERVFTRAISDVGDLPIDGAAEPLQDLIDGMYKDKPGSHRKRIMAINRLRKWRALPLLLHLRDENHEVLFITEAQLETLVGHITNPITALLARFLFYSGLRIGEAFAVTPQSIRRQGSAFMLSVSKQMLSKGALDKTKTRSNRKAYVMPQGIAVAEKWCALPDKSKYRDVAHNNRIKQAALKIGIKGFYANCLRHSYCIHLIGQGCTIDWVAQSAGHSRDVCERYYSTHSLTDDAVEMMEKAMKKAELSKVS